MSECTSQIPVTILPTLYVPTLYLILPLIPSVSISGSCSCCLAHLITLLVTLVRFFLIPLFKPGLGGTSYVRPEIMSVLQIAQVMLNSVCSLSFCRVLTWNFLPFHDRGECCLFFIPQGKGWCSSGSHPAVGSWAAHRYVGLDKAFGSPLLKRVTPAQQDQKMCDEERERKRW